MVKQKVEDKVWQICEPITKNLALELIDIEYKKEGTSYVLRIIIDKQDGVVIEDCENVSRELDIKLDEIDPIENSYTLEVQSPGERSLKRESEFQYFKGRDVELKLYEPQHGKKVFDGKLMGLEGDLLIILLENGEAKEFNKEKVANVKLKINI